MESFMKRVSQVQTETKVPKAQYNKVGNYNYRSCEDILEAVKPICSKYGFLLNLSDDMVLVGDRVYVKATAKLIDMESKEEISSTAFAREALTKKGMDESQISGTASSYARKYALSGLLGLDDNKDIDGEKPLEKEKKEPVKEKKEKPKEPEHFKCAECGKEFAQYIDKNGSLWEPYQQYEAAKKRNPDGVPRCANCRRKLGM